jgi:hypothetical protein
VVERVVVERSTVEVDNREIDGCMVEVVEHREIDKWLVERVVVERSTVEVEHREIDEWLVEVVEHSGWVIEQGMTEGEMVGSCLGGAVIDGHGRFAENPVEDEG